jgi:hypothetical protein
VIRNVVIHILNEQPLLADIYALPTAGDAGLVCTNLRSLDGKRPVFIDRIASVFFFPYRVIRFLEIAPEEMKRHFAEGGGGMPAGAVRGEGSAVDAPPDGLGEAPAGERMPVVAFDDEEERAGEDADLEIDEDFLQRIRDV